jgi:hypothetical protein
MLVLQGIMCRGGVISHAVGAVLFVHLHRLDVCFCHTYDCMDQALWGTAHRTEWCVT